MKNKKSIIVIIVIILIIVIALAISFTLANNSNMEENTAKSNTQPIDIEKYKGIEINASVVANNPLDYYGKKVSNYVFPNDATIGTQIFHSDGENIYLIADYYIPTQYIPISPNKYVATDGRGLDLENVRTDYKERDTIIDNPAQKWWARYNESGYECKIDRLEKNRFLLDVSVWNDLKSEKAEYVIGGPTVEMFVESYNKVHQDKQIDLSLNENGYLFKWSTEEEYKPQIEGLDKTEFDNLYVIHNPDDRASALIISYEGKDANQIPATFAVDFTGKIGWSTYNCMVGARPIICLNSNAILAVNENGSFIIK